MKPLRLDVPEPQGDGGRFQGFNNKRIKAWLDGLPRGLAEPLAQELRQALRELNGDPLPKASRLEAMELLRPAVYDASTMLAGEYRNASQPLGVQDREQAELVIGLLSELATGFKLAVNELLDAGLHGSQQGLTQQLQFAIQRAVLALGRMLLESYRVYAPEPPKLWQDLHTLYRNAEIYNLQGLPVEGTRDSDETALSIKQAYLRIAVLALSNPYHLMQGEAEELYRRIGRWVHFVQIREASPEQNLAGHFVIDLSSDFPARYLPHSVASLPATVPRVLVLDRLVAAIDEQIQRSRELLAQSRSSATLSERMQRDMYIRFHEALGGRQERTDERKRTLARLSVVESLSGCHYFLNGRRPFTPEQDERQWRERLGEVEKKPEKPSLRLLGDEDEDAHEEGPGTDRSSRFRAIDAEADDVWRKASQIKHEQEQARHRVRHKAVTWNRKNQSSGGMALFCGDDCPMQIRVGELLAYSEKDSARPEDWMIGTARWLRSRGAGGIELGVKHLAASGYAVGTQTVLGAGKGAEYLRGLLIPRVNPLSRPATLITPAAVYDVGAVLKLNMQQLLLYVQLTELVETTRQFSHFRFKVVEPPKSEQRG